MSRLETSPNTPPSNRLLAALSRREYKPLFPHLECVSRTLRSVLHEAGQPIKHLYFPTSGIFSLLSGREDQGGRIEVGVVGREGMVGLSAFLGGRAGPAQWMVQVPGEALRMRAAKFRRLVRRQSKLHEMLLRYTHVFLMQVMQWVSCNSLHPVEKRLCRWLLTVHDRAAADQFPLTHEFLAAMLGVRRASVTEAARRLCRAGLIDYGGGQLTILDRRGLEGSVCGCYHTVRAEMLRLRSANHSFRHGQKKSAKHRRRMLDLACEPTGTRGAGGTACLCLGCRMNGGEQEWWYAVPNDGQVFPEHLIGTIWSYLQCFGASHLKPRSETQLANLIYPAFQASLCSEEGRQVRLRIAFNPKPKRFTVRFAEPIPCTAGQLVKLAPTIGLGSRWMVALPDDIARNQVRIAGILDPDILPIDRTFRHRHNGLVHYQNQFQGLKVAVLGSGWIRVTLDAESFDLRNCCLRQRVVVGRIQYVGDWFREVARGLAIPNRQVGIGLVRRLIVTVLAKVSEARHGGCLLVLPESGDLSALPLKIKYRLESDILCTAIKERAYAEPAYDMPTSRPERAGIGSARPFFVDDSMLADSLLLDRDLDQVIDFLASLASVDGAVLLSRDLHLRGFGAEISASRPPCEDEPVEYDDHPEPLGKPEPEPLADFGMRHRSAIRFCQEVPGTMAFVISQDGGIRLFHSVEGRVRQWVELSAEEW